MSHRTTYTIFDTDEHKGFADTLSPELAVAFAKQRFLTNDDLAILSDEAKDAIAADPEIRLVCRNRPPPPRMPRPDGRRARFVQH